MAKTAVANRKTKQLALFDYGGLAVADVKRCESAVERITKCSRRMVADIIGVGKELLEVKERLEHGQFGSWLKHYFDWSQQTASRMMQAAATFKSLNLSNLTIDTSALYLLSCNKCPDELREEVIERAEKGERITHATVKQALSDLVDDDDEPLQTSRPGKKPAKYIDEDDNEKAVCPHPPQCVHDDGWSLADFLTAIHQVVDTWRDRCPTDQLEDMAQALHDMANQIDFSAA